MGTTVEQFGITNDLDDSKNAGIPIGVGADAAQAAKLSGDEPRVSLLRATMALDDGQIKALPTTPFEIVSSPGENRLIFFQSAMVVVDCAAAAYASGDFTGGSLAFTVGGQAVSLDLAATDLEGLLTDDSQRNLCWLPARQASGPQAAAIEDLDAMTDQPLMLAAVNTGGDYTGGDAANSMKVIVFYLIVDF
jgi:hypothetical protein